MLYSNTSLIPAQFQDRNKNLKERRIEIRLRRKRNQFKGRKNDDKNEKENFKRKNFIIPSEEIDGAQLD